ncbi:MAG: ATP-binding cassette domain-containing protein, partial [Actinomycetota bacterium]|nr:ATP-binding cassette domain-containing protein [Actinomycetota bacterium]
MLTVSNVTLRFGARVLMSDVSFRVAPGDKIGLVGRNGAGKTTLTRMLSGDGQPAEGNISASGSIGYLPQDPRTGDLTVTGRDRILSARGLDTAMAAMRQAELDMASENAAVAEKAMAAYSRADAKFGAGGGYAAEAEAATIAHALGLPDRVLEQQLQ